ILLDFAALLRHRLLARLRKIRPILRVTHQVHVWDLLLIRGVELSRQLPIEVLAIAALLVEQGLIFNQRSYADGVIVAGIDRQDLIDDAKSLFIFSLIGQATRLSDKACDGAVSLGSDIALALGGDVTRLCRLRLLLAVERGGP